MTTTKDVDLLASKYEKKKQVKRTRKTFPLFLSLYLSLSFRDENPFFSEKTG
jgi:hypothetical protein